ncbi:major facilitator superfamily domain-containing protein [Melanogaster broomeanus]|nr:major facilitator superfamily domain-containing protein [Melanogaster broomeanus]
MSSILHPSSDIPQDELDCGTASQKSHLCATEEQLELPVAPSLVLIAEQEAKLWRKIDLQLVPIVTSMQFFSFMDRSVIGNAKIEGMTTQLDLTGNKYNLALTMFFVTYCLCELPSKWLPTIMVVWGIIMTVMGFVKTYPQLVGARLCLGAAEAGLYPGVAYYLTLWYPRYKCQYRIAIFAAAGHLAGAFSGLIAYALGAMNGIGGLETWSWIFILDGLATLVVAIHCIFWLPCTEVMVDYPSTARFLTVEERSFVTERQGRGATQDEEQGAVPQIIAALTDWQVWALSVVQFSIAAPVYGLAYFLPQDHHQRVIFGYSTSTSQLLTVPPYLLAAGTHVTFAHFSDKIRLRSPFILAGHSIALVGFIINISDAPSNVKYFGLFLCLMGGSSSGVITWLANNLRGKYKRATGIAIVIMVANVGGAIASNIFRSQDAPRYILGIGLEIAFSAWVLQSP